jgi:hypothetical protein
MRAASTAAVSRFEKNEPTWRGWREKRKRKKDIANLAPDFVKEKLEAKSLLE